MEKSGIEENAISNLISSLNINEENQKEFRDQMIDIANKKRISIHKNKFVDWAFLVHDFNRMHVFSGYAEEAGFKRTPMHGTLISACEEQYALGILEILKKYTGKELFYNAHEIKFENPLFPAIIKAKAYWSLEETVVDENNICLNVSSIHGKEKKFISSKIVFGYNQNKEEPQEIINFLSGDNIVHKTSIEIKEGEREHFYEILGEKPIEEVSMMHVGALVPATLLELASRRTGRPEGTYRTIDFKFYNKPAPGIFETSLKMSRPLRNLQGKAFLYKFEALCIQDKKIILTGEVGCISPTEYKLN